MNEQQIDVLQEPREQAIDVNGEPSVLHGIDGVSPIAKVVQTETGATITIIDRNGTTTANILNGQDGQDGRDGRDGRDGQDGQDGQDGRDGQDGQAGRDGADGVSATITIGTTTTGQAGTNASVENVGTERDAILNFVIPRGEQGAPAQSPLVVRIEMNPTATIEQQMLNPYNSPFGIYNDFTGSKIVEANMYSSSSDVVILKDRNDAPVSWVDFINDAEAGMIPVIQSVENLGYEATLDDDVLSFEPIPCAFKSMLGISITEDDILVEISGLGLIGSNNAPTNYGGYFYPFTIELEVERDSSNRVVSAHASNIWFATTSYDE